MEDETSVVTILRGIGRRILEDRYGALTSVSGQGIQSGTRFTFADGDDRRTCAVKVVAKDHNRIHFPRAEDGVGWTTLRDVDLILYLRRLPARTDHYEAHMYSQAALLTAFDENRAHAVATGITHLPAWLSPEKEKGDRFVGSGYGDKALWKENGPIKVGEQTAVDEPVQPLTIQQAKRGIAAFLQISPDAIEITIRA
jgi:hypothetical protein